LWDRDLEDERTQLDVSSFATSPLLGAQSHSTKPNPTTPIPPVLSLEPTKKTLQEVAASTADLPAVEPEKQNIYLVYNNRVEQSLHRLNEAARRIESDPDSAARNRTLHGPRVNRLTPLHDISADIHRDNTPQSPISYDTLPGEQDVFAGQMPDFWPWLQEPEEEAENDAAQNHTDPLSTRRVPTNKEPLHIEEEDLHQATAQVIIPPVRRGLQKWLRILFICTSVLIALAFSIDIALVASINNRPPKVTPSAPPSFVLSKNVVRYGESIVLHLKNFTPSSSVVVSRDIEERVHLATGTSMIQIGADGRQDATLLIDTVWDPGIHMLEIEDMQTRYTASAMLRVDAGPTRPAHMMVEAEMVDFGSSIQGANTVQPLNLKNSGSGSITWSASSDAAWLMISPNHGVFSGEQSIQVAGSRTHLNPGDYTGKITFSSNVDVPQSIVVHMTVLPLPNNPGAVLSVAPPVLAFTAVDGMADPGSQALVISNPGSQPLYWSMSSSQQTTGSDGSFSPTQVNTSAGWLNLSQTSGMVVPGSTSSITVQVYSQNLLPGTYMSEIMLSTGDGHSALNSPQAVSVALTVQPRCALTLNTGSMSFTAVSGQDSPSSQTLSLTATAGCPGVVPWNALPSDNWLLVAPTHGQLKGITTSVMKVSVNTMGMKPGVYTGNITIAVAQNTQSVAVQLTIQAPPSPTAPIISVAPLNLNFSTIQKQPDPPGQTVTITNTGASTLFWHTTVAQLASSWLGASPSGGSIPPGQTKNLTVNVSASGLTPGSYVGQITIEGMDQNNVVASGSPQRVSINFVVLPPCTLSQPSSSTLAFNSMQGGGSPSPLQESLTVSGNCGWPVNWKASTSSNVPWLMLTPSSGVFVSSGQSATMTVATNTTGLAPGTYTTSVSISATDSAGLAAQGSPQVFTVTMTVVQPCQMQVGTSKLNFTAQQGSMSAMQNISVSETGNCAQPVTWNANADGSNWLTLASTSGHDGSLSVNADATKLAPGSYNATIIFSATGSGGSVVFGKPHVLVTLTVIGATLNGTVNACLDSTCSTLLPGAIVSLTDSSSNVVNSVIADSHGKFSLANIPNGSYTLSAKGTGAASVVYQGDIMVNVSGDQSGITINTIGSPPTPSVTPATTPVSSSMNMASFYVYIETWLRFP
jgi:hypothetical protein